jgi:hypothetical protein
MTMDATIKNILVAAAAGAGASVGAHQIAQTHWAYDHPDAWYLEGAVVLAAALLIGKRAPAAAYGLTAAAVVLGMQGMAAKHLRDGNNPPKVDANVTWNNPGGSAPSTASASFPIPDLTRLNSGIIPPNLFPTAGGATADDAGATNEQAGAVIRRGRDEQAGVVLRRRGEQAGAVIALQNIGRRG